MPPARTTRHQEQLLGGAVPGQRADHRRADAAGGAHHGHPPADRAHQAVEHVADLAVHDRRRERVAVGHADVRPVPEGQAAGGHGCGQCPQSDQTGTAVHRVVDRACHPDGPPGRVGQEVPRGIRDEDDLPERPVVTVHGHPGDRRGRQGQPLQGGVVAALRHPGQRPPHPGQVLPDLPTRVDQEGERCGVGHGCSPRARPAGVPASRGRGVAAAVRDTAHTRGRAGGNTAPGAPRCLASTRGSLRPRRARE